VFLGIFWTIMRAALGFLVVGALWAGGAKASSFVVLPAMEARVGPSMIVLDSPGSPSSVVAASTPDDAGKPDEVLEVAPGETVQFSPSVVALGEPDVGLDKVAAIAPEVRTSRHAEPPIVIRGGVVGDAFAPSAASQPVTVKQEASPQAAADAPPSAGSTPQEAATGAAPAPGQPAASVQKPE
jgi:hypothetical protein